MLLKSTPRLRRILLKGTPILLLVCATAIVLFSLSIELGVKQVCVMATRAYPGDKVDALMRCVEPNETSYDAQVYSENNHVFWALGQLGDKRALPFLRDLLTDEPCDHETNLCQDELMESIQKLEGNRFNLPAFLWRGILKY
jgi:hypothetical protein